MSEKQFQPLDLVHLSPDRGQRARQKPDVVAGRIGRAGARPRCECCGVCMTAGEFRYCDTCLWKSTTD
jgi:hypothetical protein